MGMNQFPVSFNLEVKGGMLRLSINDCLTLSIEELVVLSGLKMKVVRYMHNDIHGGCKVQIIFWSCAGTALVGQEALFLRCLSQRNWGVLLFRYIQLASFVYQCRVFEFKFVMRSSLGSRKVRFKRRVFCISLLCVKSHKIYSVQ